MSRHAGRPSLLRPLLFVAGLAGLFAVLVSLGQWQVERRAWKLDLIERVERYHSAAPESPPAPAAWAGLGKTDEYRRLTVEGHFLHDLESCVQAVTVHGPGYWIVTPLEAGDGTLTLVNRGFVPSRQCDPAGRQAGQVEGPVTVIGRLRLSEPGGGFLRENDPQADRWFSRDVAAIAAARGLAAERVAPYFLDAEDSVEGGPVGGLTVLQFRNHHLGYAATWYGLALLVALAIALIVRREWRLRRD